MLNTKTIPKTIHYFWFGGDPIPSLVKQCIKSWKKFCPDYEIKKWDESNFNIENSCEYVREAYKAKKWAFVSDYARFYILNKYGGVYLDTDVELIKPIQKIIDAGPFFACETEKFDSINPGLGMATYPANILYEEIIEDYNKSHYLSPEGVPNTTPVGKRIVALLIRDGLKNKKGVQTIDGINIYPKDYFCPFNYFTGELKFTNNTVAIHHFAASWQDNKAKKYHKFGQFMTRKFGYKVGEKSEKILHAPYSIKNKLQQIGLKRTLIYYIKKIIKKH